MEEKIMKIFWWQGGLHIEPESKAEHEAIKILAESLNLVHVNPRLETGPITGNLCHDNTVIAVHELS
jgi:hypothetical protein